MISLFNAALFARTCLSSGFVAFSFRTRAALNADNGLLLTRFCASCSRCCYSTTCKASGGVGKVKKSKKSDSKMMGEEKNAFFVVRKGDLVGVYKNLSDCQAQVGSSICDPPVSVYKGHSMPKEAEEYMISCGLKNALYSIKAADLTEELFGNLVACPYQPHFSLGELSSDHLSKRRFPEVLGSQAGESFDLTSMSSDAARKHAKLEHLATQDLTSNHTCVLEFDGASKGNPGQAGAGAVLRTEDGNLVEQNNPFLCRCRRGLIIERTSCTESNNGKPYYACPYSVAGTYDYGCGYFMWKDAFQNKYFSQASSSTQCSNCVAKDNKIDQLETRNKMLLSQNKMLMTRIKTRETSLELATNPEDHACRSGVMLHDIIDDINNLHM